MIISQSQWKEFYDIIKRMSKDALSKISMHVSENKYISCYRNYPISVNEKQYGGWYTVNEISPYEGLGFGYHDYKYSDFSSIFSIYNSKDSVRIAELDGYDMCVNYLSDNKNFLPLLWYGNSLEHIELNLLILIGNIIESYIIISNNFDYNEQIFMDAYTLVTNGYFIERYEFDICIPILFVKFDVDSLTIDEHISITKMTKEFIRWKHYIGNYDSHFEKLIVDCATHMIVIKGYYLENKDYMTEDIFNEKRAYPINTIDLIIASIRAITGFPTGYAQIIASPTNNWISKFSQGNLMGLTGAKAKSYPDLFLKHYWLEEQKVINKENCDRISVLASSLINNNHNAFKLACNRLNKSLLRDNEEDTILDAIIGLEVLLSDNDKGELTYKIASRMAMISTLYSNCPYRPVEVQKAVTKIYRYRSDIVHSRKPRSATKTIKIAQEEEITPVSLAIKFLSMAIEVLAKHPNLLNVKEIDELIMDKLK